MRTNKSLKNSISNVFFSLLIGVIGFIKVKVFVNGLSNDIYSLNQLFYQIFSYIVITDIGFGLIINKQLYNAFAEEDYEKVNKIYSTSRKFYKVIGLLMMLIAFVLSFFVKYFTKAAISPMYMQIIFIIFIFRNVVDYFFVAPRYVLEADQKIYKVNHYIKSIKIIESLIEIILVLLGIDYFFVIIPGIFVTIFIDIFVNQKIYKMYPWLKNDKSFDLKYLRGTKDVIWRKIAGLLNSNTDIILISAFINPINVIIYTSYVYITKFITDTVYLVTSSITPSFANVFFKESKEKTFSVFTELNIFLLFIASFVFIMLYGFLNSLITFWIGKQYVVNNFVLFLFCFSAFQIIAEKPIAIFINGVGLFKETKVSTIAEAILNVVISILLVNKLGIAGVLIGTVVSKMSTTFVQNAMYIYKNKFKKSSYEYFILYCSVIFISLGFISLYNIINLNITNVFSWIILVLIFSVVIFICLFLIFYLFYKSFRMLINRGIYMLKNKKHFKGN